MLVAVSIRSPHRSKGRRLGCCVVRRRRIVSIRSPHRSKGRLPPESEPFHSELFQSAPLTEARGDRYLPERARQRSRFQSAPLTEARGDDEGGAGADEGVVVSIRSPHRSKGRLEPTLSNLQYPLVSIRSPHRSKGRPGGNPDTAIPELFQSAPLTEARGDLYDLLFLLLVSSFQSAPLTEARGDPPPSQAARRPHRFNPLPSPKQGETRRRALYGGRFLGFQSAPLTEARGDTLRASQTKPLRGFNPLPSPKQGET